MKRGAGKAKGNAFESRMAKQLSLWVTEGRADDELIPSRQSGGWAGAREEQGWRQLGDLSPNGPAGDRFRQRFAVECKHHKVIDFWHIFTSKEGDNLLGWWFKLCREIRDMPVTFQDGMRPDPLLIFRMNHRPIMVALPHRICDAFGRSCFILGVQMPPTGTGVPDMGILPLEHFLLTPPQKFIQLPSRERAADSAGRRDLHPGAVHPVPRKGRSLFR